MVAIHGEHDRIRWAGGDFAPEQSQHDRIGVEAGRRWPTAAAARNPDLTASAARPYVGDSSGSINAMTSLRVGGLLTTGATGWISGGAGAGATLTVGSGGAGGTGGAGNALGGDAVAPGIGAV